MEFCTVFADVQFLQVDEARYGGRQGSEVIVRKTQLLQGLTAEQLL